MKKANPLRLTYSLFKVKVSNLRDDSLVLCAPPKFSFKVISDVIESLGSFAGKLLLYILAFPLLPLLPIHRGSTSPL